MRADEADRKFFEALVKTLTDRELWDRHPSKTNIQLHPEDRARLRREDFNGRVRNNGGFMTLNRVAGDWNVYVTLWDGKTVKKNWMAIEIGEREVKKVNLFPRPRKPKKPKVERPSRFDRDFEV